MKAKPFRQHHLIQLLEGYQNQLLPLDFFISQYFRANKALGSKDRGEIAENAYAIIRYQALLDYFCKEPITWEKRLSILENLDLSSVQADEEIPLHIRMSFPKDLFELIVAAHGLEKGCSICMASNLPAPTTIRVNTLKTNRQDLFNSWKDLYDISLCNSSPFGINFNKKLNFFSLSEFEKGLFEVQDEGSQLLALLVAAKPGDQVMDYCAGSGGKTLAFASQMEHKGQIYLHDVRPKALQEAKKRLRRSGIQNAQVVLPDSPMLPKLKKKMDWVLVDAPCSGTGTLRRNPDMKWKFSIEMLQRLTGQQRTIFEKALSYLKPEGKIVYATCSILDEENQIQMEHFIKTYDLSIVGKPFQSIPSNGGMDGFFGVVFQKNIQ